jgi:hypothetical protein
MSSSSNITYIKRRIFTKDSDLYDVLADIVEEFLDFTYPCEFENESGYLSACILSSSETFLNHWKWDNRKDYEKLKLVINKIIEKRFSKKIRLYYFDNHNC